MPLMVEKFISKTHLQNTFFVFLITEIVFYQCGLESHFTSISGLWGSILSKKLKSLYPTVHASQKVKDNRREVSEEGVLIVGEGGGGGVTAK